jgi:hypothetical protein
VGAHFKRVLSRAAHKYLSNAYVHWLDHGPSH